MKAKTCKVCRIKFVPIKPLQAVCGLRCAQSYAWRVKAKDEVEKAKAERKEIRAKRESIKTRAQWLREAQTVINKYVRLRDIDKGCVSCNKTKDWGGQWHASHWKSTGANSALRFNLWNIHKSCSVCNNWKSGNIGEYRILERIGQERLDVLETTNPKKKYEIEYLSRLKDVFSKRCRAIEKRNKLR